MPRLARGQENTPSNINWFTRVLGEFEDMYLVEFQVFRIETGLPGDQIFPSTGWEDVSASGGHFDTGHYFAYDNENVCGWTPAGGSALGTHRIQWRWKQYPSSDYQTGAEDFEVIPEVTAGPTETFLCIEIADVRAAGLTDPPYTDDRVLDAILTWQAALERACKQWFYPRSMTIRFDGDGSDTMHFGVPIISVEHLKINYSATGLGPTQFAVYNFLTTDRQNPKIRLAHSRQLSDIYDAPWSRGELRFLKGYQNQEIKGVFGCTESDGNPPRLIKRALLKLVIEKLTSPLYVVTGDVPPTPAPVYAGIVIEESTDGHSIKYGTSTFDKRKVGLSGLTQDAEILDIIKLYRAPIGIANTSQWSY